MAERDLELQTLLDDVKTIKGILTNEDAPFPQVWKGLWLVSLAMALVGLLQYVVPFFRNLDFDGRVLWLWLPAFCLVVPLLLAVLLREIRRSGKKFLGQSRVQHLLFARFVIPPAALVLIWVSSRNPAFPLEGTILFIIAIWQTAIEMVLPRGFRPVPVVFLSLGFLVFLLGLKGPEVVLFEVLLTAGAIFYGGWLFWRQDRRTAGGR